MQVVFRVFLVPSDMGERNAVVALSGVAEGLELD
jgi:hypothetical protein